MQSGVPLVPSSMSKTRARKGCKDVAGQGSDDKRQVDGAGLQLLAMALCCAVFCWAALLMPLQVCSRCTAVPPSTDLMRAFCPWNSMQVTGQLAVNAAGEKVEPQIICKGKESSDRAGPSRPVRTQARFKGWSFQQVGVPWASFVHQLVTVTVAAASCFSCCWPSLLLLVDGPLNTCSLRPEPCACRPMITGPARTLLSSMSAGRSSRVYKPLRRRGVRLARQWQMNGCCCWIAGLCSGQRA
jgi:hypothetical protein